LSKTTVSFALLLLDDYDGKQIYDTNYIFYINSKQIMPMKKPEGIYIFLCLEGKVFDLKIEGGKYLSLNISIDTSELNPLNPLVFARMHRNGRAFYDKNSALIIGSIQEKVKSLPIQVYAVEVDGISLKLSYFSQEDNKNIIKISGYTIQNLDNLNFMIGSGKNKELFVVKSKISPNSFEIDRKLNNLHKSGEEIKRVYSSVTNKVGEFCIPVEVGQETKIKNIEYFLEDKKKWAFSSVTVDN